MSLTHDKGMTEKMVECNDLEKLQTINESGDVIILSEPLSPQEDLRILRRIDMQ